MEGRTVIWRPDIARGRALGPVFNFLRLLVLPALPKLQHDRQKLHLSGLGALPAPQGHWPPPAPRPTLDQEPEIPSPLPPQGRTPKRRQRPDPRPGLACVARSSPRAQSNASPGACWAELVRGGRRDVPGHPGGLHAAACGLGAVRRARAQCARHRRWRRGERRRMLLLPHEPGSGVHRRPGDDRKQRLQLRRVPGAAWRAWCARPRSRPLSAASCWHAQRPRAPQTAHAPKSQTAHPLVVRQPGEAYTPPLKPPPLRHPLPGHAAAL